MPEMAAPGPRATRKSFIHNLNMVLKKNRQYNSLDALVDVSPAISGTTGGAR
jgi:hypothetical protein